MQATAEEPVPYWQCDLPLTGSQREAMRLRLHMGRQPYRLRGELIPLLQTHGMRTYLHARPYLPAPVSPAGSEAAAQQAEDEPLLLPLAHAASNHVEIGNVQGWCYHWERTFVLWEAALFPPFREADPSCDERLAALWSALPDLIRAYIRGIERIVTPSWQDGYHWRHWRAFLSSQGYQPLTARAHVFYVPSEPRRARRPQPRRVLPRSVTGNA